MSDTPDWRKHLIRIAKCEDLQATPHLSQRAMLHIETIERELAAAIAQRDKARNDALEEAAQVCEHVLDARKNAHITYGFNAIHGCIEAIRATAILAMKEMKWSTEIVNAVTCRQLERELAAAIKQRDRLAADLIYTTAMHALDAAKELMDCKGYDLYPDGTMRPAHGLGEWVKADDYDKLHATATTAQAQRDRAIEFLHVYRNDTPLGNQPHMIAHEVDLFLKECGK